MIPYLRVDPNHMFCLSELQSLLRNLATLLWDALGYVSYQQHPATADHQPTLGYARLPGLPATPSKPGFRLPRLPRLPATPSDPEIQGYSSLGYLGYPGYRRHPATPKFKSSEYN